MGYKLCTAEKPSVAKDIAKVIGANVLNDGYYEGNGYRVTWAVGHLITLAEPEEYGQEYTDRNNIELLPILPSTWKFAIIESVKKQFYIMKKLMTDPECDLIIDCGDMGETGHYLQWLIRMYAGVEGKKPVKRFCATSMTEEAIKHHMNNLRNIDDFKGIIKGALCKAKGDWIVGMSLSRLFSAKYHSNLTVGRVQTPTLYFVFKRWYDVMNFKPTNYYHLEVAFKNGFKCWLTKDTDKKLSAGTDEEDRIIDRKVAENLAEAFKNTTIGGGKGTITKLETKNKATDRPQLYDITELERDGIKIYGYTASEVLETAQSLYETHKVTTYPRTDSRYITSDLEPYMAVRLHEISTIDNYKDVAEEVLSKGLNIDKKIVDDTKVTDHHAIIVTEKIKNFDMSVLSEREKNILDLVIKRMLVSFSPRYLYKETVLEVTLSYDNYIVSAKGKIPVQQGWKDTVRKLSRNNEELDELDGEGEKDTDNQLFNGLSQGQVVIIDGVDVLDKQTTPPKLHTEATLLTAMENAGATITDNEQYRQILKGHGIGTQATRAEIIKKIKDVGYITEEKKGKTKYLVPTKKGYSAVKVFPKQLLSPTLTAEWETKISKVADGSMTEQQFMSEFEEFIIDIVNKYKDITVDGVDFSDKEVLGQCLWCKSDIVQGAFKDKEGKKVESYYCTNKECRFSFRKDDLVFKGRTGRGLTKSDMKKLLKNKSLTVKCKSQGGNEYDCYFEVVENNGYSNLKAGLPPKKTTSKTTKKRKFG